MNMYRAFFALGLAALLHVGAAFAQGQPAAPHAHLLKDVGKIPTKAYGVLDLDRLAQEDALTDEIGGAPKRFAVSLPMDAHTGNTGVWTRDADGRWLWQLRVSARDAAHLNFGFKRAVLPPGADLLIVATDGSSKLGPYTADDIPPHGQLWTAVLLAEDAVIQLRADDAARAGVELSLVHVGHGYRGFGRSSKACKSGACNTDVACLSADDPWNEPRFAVGAYSRNGSLACTGSLVNNTNNDRRMLFATATHCGVGSDATAQTVVVYWKYESPTCRVPQSSGQSPILPLPATTSAGFRFLAATNNPFPGGSGEANTRSDWTLIELVTPPANNEFDLFWAGWDRTAPPTTCAAPGDVTSTAGLCASIHHPGVDEKRITFVEEPMIVDNISGASGVHWRANWDPTPPRLPNIDPMPTTLPPSVTEPGSSGSPLYNAERRLVGVLSGGPSSCGATGINLRDQYGGLFHAWEGLGTPTTRMRDYLDPAGTGATAIDGIGACDPPAAPTNVAAAVTANNEITVTWDAVPGISLYRVFRTFGGCPGSGYQLLAEVDGATQYVDNTVSGGSVYSYRVASFDEVEECPSAQSACTSATATGSCALPPTFAGLTSATSNGTQECGIALSWPAASGNCGAGSDIRYNVYRSTTPGFTPGPASLFESCRATAGLVDVDVTAGVVQHYIVRAEDLGASPANGQCMGVEETNIVARSAAPFGPDTVLFNDDVEGGSAAWTVSGSGGGANFAIVMTAANSPTRSWFVPDPAVVSDRQLTMANPIALAPGTNAVLEFAHRYATENTFDGGVLEYSVDGGTTWFDILAAGGGVPANAQRFLQGGYTGTISTGFDSPIGGRQAWSGTSGVFVTSRVNLADFGGRNVHFRFRFASDRSVAATGWWIDDIRVSEGTACGPVFIDEIFADGFEPPAP